MPSHAFQKWQTDRAVALDEIVAAHRSVGGSGRGRRYATQQINHAYAMLLSSQFQGFCRDLHSECIDHLVGIVTPISLRPMLAAEFLTHRKLDRGNPNPGNIGADFSRLKIGIWSQLANSSSYAASWKAALELFNEWRNAIAHQDFDPTKLGGITSLRLSHVDQWRRTCHSLAEQFDEIVRQSLTATLGNSPW